MTLDEQIIACARSHGYKGNTTSAVRKTNEWRIYYVTGKKDNPNLQLRESLFILHSIPS